MSFYHKRVCVGKNTEKYITFSVPIENKVRIIDKKRQEITKTISCRLQCIDSARFTASLLLNSVNNLAEGIHKVKWKYGHDDKKCEVCRIRYEDCECIIE